jgi:hypothetical protein
MMQNVMHPMMVTLLKSVGLEPPPLPVHEHVALAVMPFRSRRQAKVPLRGYDAIDYTRRTP